jgi:pimeloyl-ACP methyl ester carboxylesterase
MLTGEYDYLTTPEESQHTADGIEGAEFFEMKEIGHFPMSENYPLFKGYLQQALETLSSKAGARTGIRRGATRGA